MHRRKFLQLCALGTSCFASHTVHAFNKRTTPMFISAYSDALGQYGIATINNNGEIIQQHELPSRGHSFATNPASKQIYAISRRPENTIDVLNPNGSLLTRIYSKDNRHFYGHAACSVDGRFLYTSENNLDDGSGVIGVRDTLSDFSLVNEFSSYGIGPHSIQRSPCNQFLIVANGGIQTHPNTGRKRLNKKTMSPSLVFIHIATGALHRKAQLPEENRLNSIRHFTVNKKNDVFIALQNQGDFSSQEVLLAQYHYNNNTLLEIPIPHTIQPLLKGYLGDIILDESQQTLAATSPRGDNILFYDIAEKKLWSETFIDTCGLQAYHEKNTFIISNGQGVIRLYHIDTRTQTSQKMPLLLHANMKWDNHIVAIKNYSQ